MIQDIMYEEDLLGYEARGFISMDNVETFADRRAYYDQGNINRFMYEMPGKLIFVLISILKLMHDSYKLWLFPKCVTSFNIYSGLRSCEHFNISMSVSLIYYQAI